MNYMTLFHVLKNLLLVISNYFKLVHILHFDRVFKYAKLIFKLIFENPYPSMGGWMGDHALYAQIENLFKHV